jgi:surface antigen
LRPRAYQSALQCLTLYRARGGVGLSAWSAKGKKSAAVTVILIALGTGGCSLNRSDGPFAKMGENEVTGSVARSEPVPTDTDLAYARDAASDVLTKGDKDSSQPWSNPQTGARGSVTPLAQAYTSEDGRICRDFLASYVNGKTESWLQGAGCQAGRGGHWEIHTLRPWSRG